MKKILSVGVLSLFLAGSVAASEAALWSAKSTEKQHEQTIAVVTKSAAATTALSSQTKQSALENSASANDSQTSQARMLTTRPYANSFAQSYWIYDAWVSFHTDMDRDGFYSHFTVEFDADTEFNHARVYARLYLARNEVFKEYHTTSNFSIYRDNNNDSFVVESELLTGFRAADYEVLIELYDANTDILVATLDGMGDADLYLLPLESSEYEDVYGDQVVIIHESGGSMGWLSIFLSVLLGIKVWNNRL